MAPRESTLAQPIALFLGLAERETREVAQSLEVQPLVRVRESGYELVQFVD